MEIATYKSWQGHTPNLKGREKLWKEGSAPMTVLIDGFPDKEVFSDYAKRLINHLTTKFSVSMGVAICNPLDDFSKKIGREKAKEKMSSMEFELICIEAYLSESSVFLIQNTNKDILLGVTFKPGNDRPYIEVRRYKDKIPPQRFYKGN